jgi:hypothetical protein
MSILRRKHIDTLEEDVHYYSKRYDKHITIPKGFSCDGATFVVDTKERCYRLHDFAYWAALFDDGTPISFEQANTIYCDYLLEMGHPLFALTRKALHWLGRPAWNSHRRREMNWQNTKIVARWKVERGIR